MMTSVMTAPDSTKSEQYHTGDIVQTNLLILIMGSGVRVCIWIAGIQS